MAQWDDSENQGDTSGGGGTAPNPFPNGPTDSGGVGQIQSWYQQYLGRAASLAEINAQQGNPGGLAAVEQLIKSSPEAQAYAAKQAPAPTPADPVSGDTTTKPATSDPQTPPDIYNAPLTKPYDGTFTAPSQVNLGGPAGISYIPQTPTFTGANAPPQLGNIPKFEAPSVADALNDPGYQFRQQQGMYGVQNAAAARGTLNDSSTFKALSDYNQNAASQEYDNVWNRALNAYGTNVQSQYLMPFQANEQNWMAGIVNPAMTGYTTQAAAGANQNGINYQNAWSQFLNGQYQYNNWQDRTWQKVLQGATA